MPKGTTTYEAGTCFERNDNPKKIGIKIQYKFFLLFKAKIKQ